MSVVYRNSKQIQMAAKHGNLEKVLKLLNAGVDVNTRYYRDDCTILTLAAYSGHADVVKLLLDRGANAKLADNNGATPIHAASYKGHTDIVRMLLDHGADPNAASNDGTTALHYSWKKPDIARLLLERGAKVNQRDKKGNTALHRLYMNDSNPKVVPVLLEYGIDIHSKNHEGKYARELFFEMFRIPKHLYILEQYHMKALRRSCTINKINELLSEETTFHLRHYLYKVNVENFDCEDLFHEYKDPLTKSISVIIDMEDFEIVLEALKVNRTISCLDVKNFASNSKVPYLDFKYFETLVEAIKMNTNIEVFDLEGSFLFDSEMENDSVNCEDINQKLEILAHFVQDSKSCKRLNLGRNSAGNEGAKILGTSVSKNSCLKHLHLNGNLISNEGARAFALALKENHSLSILDLSFNQIGNTGAAELASLLTKSNTLTDLSLAYNRIGTDGAVEIACALESNAVLVKLNLDGNGKIGRKAVKAFEYFLRNKNFSLLELNLFCIGGGDLKFVQFCLELNKAGRSIVLKETSDVEQVEALIKTREKSDIFHSLLLLRPELCDYHRNISSSFVPSAERKRNNVNRRRSENASVPAPSEFKQTFTIVNGSIRIRNEVIGLDAIQRLKTTIESNKNVYGVRLIRVRFDNLEEFLILSKITQLTDLYLEGFRVNQSSQGEEVAKTMAYVLKNKTILKCLKLPRANVGDAGCRALAEALKHNTTLKHLSVSDSDVKDEGCIAIAKMLEQYNNSLTHLDLSGNRFSKESYLAFARALTFNTGLKSLLLERAARVIESNGIPNAFEEALKFNFIILEIKLSGLTLDETMQLNFLEFSEAGYRFFYKELHDCIRKSVILDEVELEPSKCLQYVQSLKGTKVCNLSLRNRSIGEAGCEIIANEILLPNNETTCIETLNMENNDIGEYGCKAICRALCNNVTLTDLNLNCNRIGRGDIGCSEIMNALATKNKTLQRISLQSNDIDDDDFMKLCPLLYLNTTLTHLDLMSNKIGADGCNNLANAIANNPGTRLCNLNLGNNTIGDIGCVLLCNALIENATLKYLNLESNDIGDDACKAIAKLLLENNCLLDLNLDFNHIADDGFIEICTTVLHSNDQTLERMGLRHNEISDDGCEALLEALESSLADFSTNVDITANKGISEHLLSYWLHKIRDRLCESV